MTANIDYSDTHLSENELVNDLRKRAKERQDEINADKARMVKAHNFRFKGGML